MFIRLPYSLVSAALVAIVAIIVLCSPRVASAEAARPKLLILTDIGNDPDDQQSMVRLIAHSNEYEIVGLVASSFYSKRVTHPEYIEEIIKAYGEVQANFAKHAPGYAPAAQLLSVVRAGTPMLKSDPISKTIGPGKDTPASNQIIAAVDAATADRPVNISIWGGAADLAQALDDVRRTRSATDLEKFMSRIRVHASYDQDGTGAWINKNFPALRYILSADVEVNGKPVPYSAPLRGMYQNDTRSDKGGARQVVPDEQLGLVARPWVDAKINSHGPLGATYPSGKSTRYKHGIWQNPANGPFVHNSAGEGQKEGDTPTWLYFMPNGLHIVNEPTFGGWGGRFQKADADSTADFYVGARDRHWSEHTDASLEAVWTVARFRQAVQNEFAARMDWSMAERYEDANHPPKSPLEGLYGYKQLTVGNGQEVKLSGAGWTDPDGDALTYRWSFYAEPSTPGVTPKLVDPSAMDLVLAVPEVKDVAKLHLILEVTDQPREGLVPMTRYQRVVLMVDPAAD